MRRRSSAGSPTERHLCTLVTLRRDGTPHVVPVGVTLDVETGPARVICTGGTQKARSAERSGIAAVSRVDGRRSDPDAVAEAVRRYAGRYRQPRANPERDNQALARGGAFGDTGTVKRVAVPPSRRGPPA
jgi:hypothetical protein